MSTANERLFSPAFFVMCGFTFTVFLSVFQLLPTVPFHILDLGGTTAASGLFLGFLTYSSAFSAPFTGAFVDRVGQRRVLLTSSLALTVFSAAYGAISSVPVMLAMVLVHGVFWSGLLSASAAYMTDMLPVHRRAEGIGYWGLASVAAMAVAPTFGFWVYQHGWIWLCIDSAALNLIMAAIAWRLHRQHAARAGAPAMAFDGGDAAVSVPEGASAPALGSSVLPATAPDAAPRAPLLEWRVLVISFTLFLYSFGYGGITSFTGLYADANGVSPKSLYLTTLAIVVLVTRPLAARLGDRLGYRRVFLPCLVLISLGMALLAGGGSRGWIIASALCFGCGFGTAYPVYVAYVMQGVGPERRGAAFGAILAAFDTGIGTGSTSMGWIVQHYGFQAAFGLAAAVSALALPYFLVADRWSRLRSPGAAGSNATI
jgi:MFS family permease